MKQRCFPIGDKYFYYHFTSSYRTMFYETASTFADVSFLDAMNIKIVMIIFTNCKFLGQLATVVMCILLSALKWRIIAVFFGGGLLPYMLLSVVTRFHDLSP